MKKILLGLLLVMTSAIGALLMTFTPKTLAVDQSVTLVVPPAQPPEELKISTVYTGKMLSQAGFAYRGGSLTEPRVFNMGALLVQHPKGTLLIDSGFGRNVDEHFETIPKLMQATSKYEKETPAVDQLAAAGIDPSTLMGVVLTHAHWDHVSGLQDLKGAPVWVTQAEMDFINSGNEMTTLIRSFGALPYKVYGFPNGAYFGFDHSYDVFGDGSVVLVPAPGHTPGSIIAFITLHSGQRYAMVGDLAWQQEGLALPAEKPWISRRMVDQDAEGVRQLLVHMYQVQKAAPDMIIVPAHDRRVWDRLPRFKN